MFSSQLEKCKHKYFFFSFSLIALESVTVTFRARGKTIINKTLYSINIFLQNWSCSIGYDMLKYP